MVKVPTSGDPFIGEAARSVDAGAQAEIVLDGSFLFTAEFTRLGEDLLLQGGDGAELLLRDYFAQVPPPALESADGARLAPATVEALAGPAVPPLLAQAGDTPFGTPIGEVSSLDGIARVQRADGSRGNLHDGDPVFQGDVVATGFGSQLGILFVDDTVFSLSANARMVLDELVYNPSGTANSMGISLVQGTFVFVTGKVAPSGEMDVATPAGTIGIRGTTVGVRIAAFSGTTRIANIENPETGETGRFTFSNFGGTAQFTQANQFLEIRSADALPGSPGLLPSDVIRGVFGQPLSGTTEIQRRIGTQPSDDRTEGPQETEQQQAQATSMQTGVQTGVPFEPPLETGAPGDAVLGEGSGFAAGLTPGDINPFGLSLTGLLSTGPLGGVEISGFGLLSSDDRFHLLLRPAPDDPDVPRVINAVYLIDVSGSMGRASDGSPASPSSPSRLELAKQTLLALNQQFIDAGLADQVTIKVIAFRADTDTATIDAASVEFTRADDSGLQDFLNGLTANGGTQYEGPLRVAADWLRDDLDPGAGIAERHEEADNFIYLFSDGGETYLPDAALVADLYGSGGAPPNISGLTIEAFAIGQPGASDFSTDQLGKVETGSAGRGGQVTVISDPGDVTDVFSAPVFSATASASGAAPAEALQLADLLGDTGPQTNAPGIDATGIDATGIDATGGGALAAGEPAGSGDAAARLAPAGFPLSAVDGVPGMALGTEDLIASAQG